MVFICRLDLIYFKQFKILDNIFQPFKQKFISLYISFHGNNYMKLRNSYANYQRKYSNLTELFVLEILSNCVYIIMLNRNQYKSISRLNWTPEEQELLKFLRQNQGIKSWTMISSQLNKVIEGKNRSGKQCRERYMNYVRFAGSSNNSSKWTVQEQKQLFQYFLIDGRKWVQICKKLNGKSQNCLKNRFYGAIRKISRRINKTFKEQKIKQKKILKQQTFIKILETKESSSLEHQKIFSNQNLNQLKNDIVRLAIIPEQDLQPQQIISFTNKVYDYLSHIKPNPEFKKSLKKIEQTKIENQVVELEQVASSLNIYTPKLSGQVPEIFQQYEDTKFKEERTYLSELGLEFIKYNSSVTYDLDKQVGEILNEDFIQQNLHIL